MTYVQNNPDYDIKIIFAVLDGKILATGEETLKESVGDEKIEDSVIRWCRKYSVLFHVISEDEELRSFFEKHSVYQPPQGHHGLYGILDSCFHEAYDSNVVITDYLFPEPQVSGITAWIMNTVIFMRSKNFLTMGIL